MDHLPKVLAGLLGLFAASTVSAGYAQLSPPAGFVQSATSYLYRAAANSGSIVANTVRTNAALNVGGRAVLVPVAMRFAANAPLFAARMVYVNPALAIGIGVGALAIMAWVNSGGVQWDEAQQAWVKPDPNIKPSTGSEYQINKDGGVSGWYPDMASACNAGAAAANAANVNYMRYQNPRVVNGNCVMDMYEWDNRPYSLNNAQGFNTRGSACPVGWYETPAGCVSQAPAKRLTQPEFEEALSPKTVPDNVPQHLPEPLPVEQPKINPGPAPGLDPTPFDVPQGNPQLVPNSDPQEWKTPVIRVEPAPTPQQPLQVDLKPLDIKRPTPEPLKPLEPIKPPDPDKPDVERTPDLCEKYPNILACQELDTPESPDLPNTEKPMNFLPDTGWGADNATCPPPRHLQMMGQNIPVPFDLFCTYMAGLRPIIIAMAWLSAAFILTRKND